MCNSSSVFHVDMLVSVFHIRPNSAVKVIDGLRDQNKVTFEMSVHRKKDVPWHTTFFRPLPAVKKDLCFIENK